MTEPCQTVLRLGARERATISLPVAQVAPAPITGTPAQSGMRGLLKRPIWKSPELEAQGYDLARMRGIASPRRGRFSAALTAQVEGVVSEAVGQELAEHILDALSERDAALVASAEQLGATRTALRELAAARFWQRPRVLRRLRGAGMLSA